ncbi:MAG: amidohydrolase family protein [Sphingopyxis sp.]|nr:amidohydrolase family protein [Sphingopyxis sp.]
MSVLVADDRISRVFRHDEPLPQIAGKIIDGTGITVIPGLHDMHVHIWDQTELAANLMHGVTTVRNMSGMPFHLRLSEQVEAGEVCGSHLLTSGPILNSKGPDSQIYHQLVETEKEARGAVRQQYAVGFRRLKIYSNLSGAAYHGARDEAHQLGMIVTGHAPEGERLFDAKGQPQFTLDFGVAVTDGFETIEHVEAIAWHGLKGAADHARARVLARRIAAEKGTVTPTLVAHLNLVEVAQSRGAYANRGGVETMPPLAQLVAGPSISRWSQAQALPERKKHEFFMEFTRILDEEGVKLVAGSDAGIFTNIPGESLLDELELLADALASPSKAIKAATATPAEVLGRKDETGCLGEGCAADLVLYRCNPMMDINCLRRPEAVIMRGRLFDADQLRGERGLRALAADHNNERTFTNVLDGFAAQGNPVTPQQLGEAIKGSLP